MLDQTTDIIGSIPEAAYLAVFAGLGVSIVLQVFKKWLALQSDKLVTFLLMLMSFIPVALDYVMNQVAQNPAVLGSKTFLVMGLATTAYRYIVKPATTILEDAKKFRETTPEGETTEVVEEPTPEAATEVATPTETFAE